MLALFYQKHCSIIDKDVTSLILNFLNFSVTTFGTFVTLIPKFKSQEPINDLRPISLCNVLYKLISKVLDNRLEQVLPSLIHIS